MVLTVLTCPLLFCWIQKLTLLLRKESSLPKLLLLGLPVSLAPSRAPRRAYPFPLFLTTVNGSRYDTHPPQVEQIGKRLEKKKVNIIEEGESCHQQRELEGGRNWFEHNDISDLC